VPVNVEVITGSPCHIPYLIKDFWNFWSKARARDFAAFDALARLGKKIPPHHSSNPSAEQAYQKNNLEDSIAYCKQMLGPGSK
jgi:hypothetical protein